MDGTIKIYCNFFIHQQLELDILPEEITGPSEHENVLSFVQSLAAALEFSSDVTPENPE
jgi:hypothetical protein